MLLLGESWLDLAVAKREELYHLYVPLSCNIIDELTARLALTS